MDDVRSLHATAAEAETGHAGKEEIVAEELAKKIDFPVLAPTLTEEDLYQGCLLARSLGLGTVVLRPCDVGSAERFLGLGVLRIGSVVGHPHGSSNTGVKVYECRDLLRRGVKQINVYPNPGKLLSRQFQHVEVELIQFADSCIEAGAVMKIVVDNALLNDEMKIILCRMAKRVNAHYVTTTAAADLELLRKYCGDRVKVECGGVETLDQARAALELGCDRISTRVPEWILKSIDKHRGGAATAT